MSWELWVQVGQLPKEKVWPTLGPSVMPDLQKLADKLCIAWSHTLPPANICKSKLLFIGISTVADSKAVADWDVKITFEHAEPIGSYGVGRATGSTWLGTACGNNGNRFKPACKGQSWLILSVNASGLSYFPSSQVTIFWGLISLVKSEEPQSHDVQSKNICEEFQQCPKTL